MKRKNIIGSIIGMMAAATVDDPPVAVFSTVDNDYLRPVSNDDLEAAPFANVRWIMAAEGDPSFEALGVWDGQVEIHIVNSGRYAALATMTGQVDDAVDTVINLVADNPTLGDHVVNAWVASWEDTPTDLSGKLPVKSCRVIVSMKFCPVGDDDESEDEAEA